MRRTLLTLGGAMVLLVGCGGSDDAEPLPSVEELRADDPAAPEPTASADATPGPTAADATTEPAEEPEPEPEFTQPFLPEDEPNVVVLPDAVTMAGTDDLDEEQVQVVEDLAGFVADWDAVLFGVQFEESGVADTATGDQIDSLGTFATESLDLQRVFVGPATELDVLEVSVEGDAATVEACLRTPGWVELREGAFFAPADGADRSTLGLVRDGDRWLTESSVSGDAAECSPDQS